MADWGMESTRRSPFVKWKRLEANGATALLVTFPFEGLASSPLEVDPAKVVWLAPPAKGEAAKVAFIFIRGIDQEKEVQISPPAQTLAYCHLDNGETLLISGHTMSFDPEPHFGWYREPRSAAVNFLTPTRPSEESFLMRSVFHGNVPEVGTFEVFDIAIHVKPTIENEGPS